jgi:hypothetical protein
LLSTVTDVSVDDPAFATTVVSDVVGAWIVTWLAGDVQS